MRCVWDKVGKLDESWKEMGTVNFTRGISIYLIPCALLFLFPLLFLFFCIIIREGKAKIKGLREKVKSSIKSYAT